MPTILFTPRSKWYTTRCDTKSLYVSSSLRKYNRVKLYECINTYTCRKIGQQTTKKKTFQPPLNR